MEVMKRVREHLLDAHMIYAPDQTLGIFLQGSQNYKLDTPESDVDTKVLIFPTFEALAMDRKFISTTHIRQNNEHFDAKDIRHYLRTFRSQNINFMEILYTPYFVINPDYTDLWQELVQHKDTIVHYHPAKAVMSMCGQAESKYAAMYRRSEAKVDKIDKFGYDPKELCHLARFCYFLEFYTLGEKYEDCLVMPEEIRTKLIDYKQGKYTEPEARELREHYMENINRLKLDFFNNAVASDLEPNKEVDEYLDDWQLRVMRRAMKKEVEKW